MERSDIAGPSGRPKGEAKPRQNSELKKMLADEMLKNRVLKETLRKKW